MGRKFEGIGDFTINGKDLTVDGVTSFEGGEYNRITIDGVVTAKGQLKANELDVSGVFNSKSNITAKGFSISGVANFKGNLRCQRAEIDGVVNVKEGKMEADRLFCDGVLTAGGEINADQIEVDGCLNAKEVYGDRVRIHSTTNEKRIISKGLQKVLKGFSFNGNPKGENEIERMREKLGSKIKNLEATKVDLEYTEVTFLAGNDITIGEGCYVENVDCDGHLRVSSLAVVKNVTGNHTYEEMDD